MYLFKTYTAVLNVSCLMQEDIITAFVIWSRQYKMFYFHTCSLVSFFSELNTVGAWTAGIDMNFPFVFTCTLVVVFLFIQNTHARFSIYALFVKIIFVFVGKKILYYLCN